MYKKSWRGKTSGSLFSYFLKIFLPILVVVALWEDGTNAASPRRGWWKNKISIPDLHEYLMFEVAGADRNADKGLTKEQALGLEQLDGPYH